MNIGLYFGSFNPVHVGHLAIANYMVEFTDIDQLWFIVSPQNPFKKKETLLNDFERYDMVELAIGNDDRFRVSDIEFRLPKPSYTIDTLTYLQEQFPRNVFSLIIGSDNLPTFNQWKNYQLIEGNYKRYVYPRRGSENIDPQRDRNVEMVKAPVIEISSSFIRDAIRLGKDIRYFLPDKVYDYILKMNLYLQ
ncbi:MAG TPA: nicotinate (nicotinamide) nucleotide adenylyltransferase [Bacteroidales bacterium]|nr:nicotinate (nicotinamide) nucleotide adenylyltransferase [Bacteroidales bacterium]